MEFDLDLFYQTVKVGDTLQWSGYHDTDLNNRFVLIHINRGVDTLLLRNIRGRRFEYPISNYSSDGTLRFFKPFKPVNEIIRRKHRLTNIFE